jgi:hypothetical protein
MRYAIVIEKAEKNYAAYVPDLPENKIIAKSGLWGMFMV